MKQLRYSVSGSGTLRLFAVLKNGKDHFLGEIGPISVLAKTAALSCWMLNMTEQAKQLDLLEVEDLTQRESVAQFFFNEDGTMRHLRVERINGKPVWICTALTNKVVRQTTGKHGRGPIGEAAYYADYIATIYGVEDDGTKFLLRHGADALARQILNNRI